MSKAGSVPIVPELPTAPKDDGDFLAYYKKLLDQFDTLHVIRGLPIHDHRIQRLRPFMETNYERLRSHPAHKVIAQIALSNLRKFPDFIAPLPAPPPYPPPPRSYSRRTASRVPAADSFLAQPPTDWAPSVTMGSSRMQAMARMQAMSGAQRSSNVLGASSAQRRMLVSLAATFATPSVHPRSPPPHWSEPHFASLPQNLVVTPVAAPRPFFQYGNS